MADPVASAATSVVRNSAANTTRAAIVAQQIDQYNEHHVKEMSFCELDQIKEDIKVLHNADLNFARDQLEAWHALSEPHQQ